MTHPISTCVLGVGLSGLTFHVPFVLALPDLFSLHSVLERNPTSEGGKVKERFGVTPKIHRSLDDVLADDEIELIIVGTPSETHYSFAKSALNAGKHVLVDKPVTTSVEQALELDQLAKSKNLVLYAYQNRRWDSDFLALKKLLAQPEGSSQSLGVITEFESHFDRYRKTLKGTWKDEPLPGNGLTYDLGTHLIDQAVCLFGRPSKITAFIQNIRGIGNPAVDDNFTIHLHYDAGAQRPYPLTAILRAHPLSVRQPQVRYIVRGIDGTYIKYGVDVQEDQLKLISSPFAIAEKQFGVEPEYMWGEVEKMEADGVTVTKTTWPSNDAGAYVGLFRNLAGAIRNGEELAVKWAEATAITELVELAHQSAREGRTLSVPAALVFLILLLFLMSVVDIIVEVPSYSYRLTVGVPIASTILEVKQEIELSCPGGPRTDKQRLIALGRELADDERIESIWKAAPRTVHLAVGHSGWTSAPPGPVPQTPSLSSETLSQYRTTSQQEQPTYRLPEYDPDYAPGRRYPSWTPPTPGLTPSASYASARSSGTSISGTTATTNRRSAFQPRPELEYVYYMHQKALNALCPEILVAQQVDDPLVSRNAAMASLERRGWLWPAVLDEDFPRATPSLVEYAPAVVDGQRYLQLSESSNGQKLSARQEHALKVLTQTFTILSMSPTPTPTVRTQQQPQSVPIPPHVNQLLQQLGLPPMRVVGVPGQNPPVGANQNNAMLGEIRQIPLRPLLAPLVMLILRTLLLLYFVAPARKPIFGVLILGWMLYEIWQPIRNGLRNGWGRIPQNGNGQQPPNMVPNAGQGGPNAGAGAAGGAALPNANAPPAPGGGPALPNAPVHARPQGPVTLEQQAAVVFDTLANMNIEEEQRLLDQGATAPAAPPSFGHKLVTFLGLFVTTLHPAVWNRRREALRRREGVVRTEANVRNSAPPTGDGGEPTAAETEATRRREELRAQYTLKPQWIQQYEARVLAEDWVDDSD